MEKVLGDVLTQGLTPALTLALLKLLLIFFIAMAIRNWIADFVNRRSAYRKLRRDEFITEGAWVSLPTTTGTVDAKIDRITPRKVVLLTKDKNAWVHIPILKFVSNQVVLLDTAPAS